MPIPAPILDDRSYQQLRDELVRRIPVYAPEWTDINASDPGIALVELFAFLGENLLFRFNQIPETTRLEFLRLLGVPLRPAAPARTLVSFTTTDGGGALLPKRQPLGAGALPFETETETVAWPLSCVGVSRAATPLPDDEEIGEWARNVVDAARLTAGERPAYYANEYVAADPAAPGATSVDLGAAVDRMLWLAVLGERGVDLTKLPGQVLNVGVVPDLAILPTDPTPPSAGEGADETAGPPVRWQVSLFREGDGVPRYLNLAVAGDTTRGLTQEGVVRLRLPREIGGLGVFAPGEPDLVGTRDLPPELERDEERGKLLFWLRAFRDDGGRFGRILWTGLNVAEAVQAASAPTEFLGTGTGQAHQRATLAKRPVVDRSLVLEVEEPGGWARWHQVDDFYASRDDDRVYVLDPEASQVQFGDGVRGRAPQIGERIRATSYRYGGGRDGNVPAQAIKTVGRSAMRATRPEGAVSAKVSNPLGARGGQEAETVAQAVDRVPGELRRRDRAVTRDDFAELALATPGADVARAECLPLVAPQRPDDVSPGVVTVVVWPREDRRSPDAPLPDRTLLRSVCTWLDSRRLVTTELYVVPPVYREIAVSVGVEVKDGYGVEAVRRWVELVLRQYLAPLPPYGPEGGGWPLNRPVVAAELQAAALQVEGVQYLRGLRLARQRSDGVWEEVAETPLRGREVPVLGGPGVTIAVYTAPQDRPGESAPDPTADPAPPSAPDVPVPIPIPKVEC